MPSAGSDSASATAHCSAKKSGKASRKRLRQSDRVLRIGHVGVAGDAIAFPKNADAAEVWVGGFEGILRYGHIVRTREASTEFRHHCRCAQRRALGNDERLPRPVLCEIAALQRPNPQNTLRHQPRRATVHAWRK